jgi:hypothetical protein
VIVKSADLQQIFVVSFRRWRGGLKPNPPPNLRAAP